jgi:hypothetical protein
MRPADVGNWSYDKWLPLFIIWIVGYILIVLNAEKGAAMTFKWILSVVMIMLIVVLPVWSWVVTPSTASQRAAAMAEIPLTSMPEEKWPELEMAAGIDQKSKEVRFTPELAGKRMVTKGAGYKLMARYRNGTVCDTDTPCPDGQIALYVVNELPVPNKIRYAFK